MGSGMMHEAMGDMADQQMDAMHRAAQNMTPAPMIQFCHAVPKCRTAVPALPGELAG